MRNGVVGGRKGEGPRVSLSPIGIVVGCACVQQMIKKGYFFTKRRRMGILFVCGCRGGTREDLGDGTSIYRVS